jgi:hypothetical protein
VGSSCVASWNAVSAIATCCWFSAAAPRSYAERAWSMRISRVSATREGVGVLVQPASVTSTPSVASTDRRAFLDTFNLPHVASSRADVRISL